MELFASRAVDIDHRPSLAFIGDRECRAPAQLGRRVMPENKSLKAAFDAKAFLAKVGVGISIKNYSKNDSIFDQGDSAETVCYIQSGKVKATVHSDHGKEAIIGIFQHGQFFGEGCLENALRTSTIVALEECLITSLTKNAMHSVLDRQPKFSAFFTSHILSRSARIEEDLIDQLFNSSERRLARLLLLLANFGKDGLSSSVPVTLSQEALAEIIGTTRSRVSFFMNQFRKKGLISYNGKIEVHASLLDAVLREKPHIKDAE
jgi:CRP/FNR family cyclic AMP-dependent transcriptional regulator